MKDVRKTFHFQILCILFMIGVLLAVWPLHKNQMTYKAMYIIQQEENMQLTDEVNKLRGEMDVLKQELEGVKETEVIFYMSKLEDTSFTRPYGEGQTWYIAAESLGMIGKPAIPYLIRNIDTEDDYERTLTFYALLLATQHEKVKEFAGNHYIKTGLEFDVKNHEHMKELALDWWEKYKHNWE